jgi:hypothetical protein
VLWHSSGAGGFELRPTSLKVITQHSKRTLWYGGVLYPLGVLVSAELPRIHKLLLCLTLAHFLELNFSFFFFEISSHHVAQIGLKTHDPPASDSPTAEITGMDHHT